jgi:hypothetical protein
MKTAILGRPIITLPTPHPEIRYIRFTPAERIIYRIVSKPTLLIKYLKIYDGSRLYIQSLTSL